MNQPALILAVFYAVGVVLGDLFVVPIFTLFIVLFIFGFLGLGVHGLARRLSTVVGKQDYHASSLDCVYGLCEIARDSFFAVTDQMFQTFWVGRRCMLNSSHGEALYHCCMARSFDA